MRRIDIQVSIPYADARRPNLACRTGISVRDQPEVLANGLGFIVQRTVTLKFSYYAGSPAWKLVTEGALRHRADITM